MSETNTRSQVLWHKITWKPWQTIGRILNFGQRVRGRARIETQKRQSRGNTYYGGWHSVTKHIKKMQEDNATLNCIKVINQLFVKKGSEPSHEALQIKRNYKEKLIIKQQVASGLGSNFLHFDDIDEEELEDYLGLYTEVAGTKK
ncbi:unnamed protein product [Cuscuta campestris]|uniref:Uncharacterized protein n=1 Tax=Cuscuta campestris TaxID=132261 RepID=A0A484JZB5_9ASTE|nr:unnamed protein product [Cuscuta campestris]